MSRKVSIKSVLEAVDVIDNLSELVERKVLRQLLTRQPHAVIGVLKELDLMSDVSGEVRPMRYKVVLEKCNGKINLIRWIRCMTGAGLKESKDMVEGLIHCNPYPYAIDGRKFTAWELPGVMGQNLDRVTAEFLAEVGKKTSDSYKDDVAVVILDQDEPHKFIPIR